MKEPVFLGMSVPYTKTLVLGLGNPILTDDGVGIHVARAVAARLMSHPHLTAGIRFVEASVGGLRLLEVLAGYDRVILVDAIQTTNGVPGDIYQFSSCDLRSSLHSGSTHDLTLPGALAWGRQVGMALPSEDAILILAVEVQDVLTFGEICTPAVAAAISPAVDSVLALIGDSTT
jgi:hydrogenase maturation protease